MPSFTRDLPEEAATAALAASFARLLRPGDVIALDGPLGAGKTTFTRSLAAALGVQAGLVSSPTFVFVNQYPIPVTSPNPNLAGGQLIHVDAYRLNSPDDLESLGWDQLFDDATRAARGHSAAIVEWPQRIAAALPEDAATLTLEPTGPTARRLTLRLPETWASRPDFDRFAAYAPILCTVSEKWVEPLSPTWPFFNDRARLADLHGWFTGAHGSSRPAEPDDEPPDNEPRDE